MDQLVVETSGGCNRRCPGCLRQSYPTPNQSLPLLRTVRQRIGTSELMPENLFRKIFEEAAKLGFHGRVTLQFFNEPLLDERLEHLGRIVKGLLPYSPLLICSNADLMTPERAASLDGLFDQINIALYMPRQRQTKRELELLSWFKTTRLNFTKGDHVVTHHSASPDLEQVVAEVVDRPCTLYNRWLIVNWDGTVSHCCDDISGIFDLGNLKDLSMREVWFGSRNRELVRTLSRAGGRRSFDYCRCCPRLGGTERQGTRALLSAVLDRVKAVPLSWATRLRVHAGIASRAKTQESSGSVR